MPLEVDITGTEWKARASEQAVRIGAARGVREAGHFVTAEAKLRAPISPKQSQVKLKRGHKYIVRVPGLRTTTVTTMTTRRKMNPGGLTRSIRVEFTGEDTAHVFVPTNSEAGKYARYIHDQRYIKWRNLGVGSVAKSSGGKPVGEKYIERAYSENVDKVRQIFDSHIVQALAQQAQP